MNAHDEGARLVVMSREECLQMLASLNIGRLAVAVLNDAPLVVPVNYVLDGETIVFRTSEGSKLDALRYGPVSFQVDVIDHGRSEGWSVLVAGVAQEATAADVEHLELRSWAAGEKAHWIRIHPTRISGRWLDPPELPWDTRGYL